MSLGIMILEMVGHAGDQYSNPTWSQFFHLIATFLVYISKSDKLTLNFDIYINQLMEHEDAYRYIKDTWICLSTIINHSSGSYRSSRKFTKHPNIMCTKNHPGR